MTVYELAIEHVRSNGVPEDKAVRIVDKFGAGAGKDIGWADIAPRLSPLIVQRLDDAAVGWMMAHECTVCEGEA